MNHGRYDIKLRLIFDRPALTSFGSPLGLQDIEQEPSTEDGPVFDPLTSDVPEIIGGDGGLIRAVDGLQYSSRDAQYENHSVLRFCLSDGSAYLDLLTVLE